MLLSVVILWSSSLLMGDVGVKGDITGTNPANGTCLCFSATSVNIRATPCGTVIGSANSGNCYQSKGVKEECTLSGVNYEFFLFNFAGRDGWAAGTFLNTAGDELCGIGIPSDGYTCEIVNQGQRLHETTAPTPSDCRDIGCGNTCQGGQSVAYVTCRCTKNENYPPATTCWRPGTRLMLPNGQCNRNIPINTAIATFDSNGNYYEGHAAVFVGCQNDYTIRTYDQWCCRSLGYSTYTSSHSYYSTYAVITNPGVCADRPSWTCRAEDSGSSCCPASVVGCTNNKYWWLSFMDSRIGKHSD